MEKDFDDLSSLTFMENAEEFQSISNLQKIMLDITSETISETLNEIINAGWISSRKTLKQFVHTCVIAAEYRPNQIETVAKLISNFMKFSKIQEDLQVLANSVDDIVDIDVAFKDDNHENSNDIAITVSKQPNYLFLLPYYLVTTIFRGLYYTKPFPKESSHLCFLFNCFKHGVIPILDIIHQIKIFSKETTKTERSLCWIFCYFAPEIEEKDPLLFTKLRNILDRVSKKNNFPPVFRHFYNNYENIAKNNWTVFKTKRDQLYHKNTLVARIRKDDVDFFKELLISPDYDINKRILPTIYAQSSYLQNHPTLIQIAAFFGAVKTFRYLMNHNADLNVRDFHSMSLPQFAVAGGNIEIIRICQQNGLNFAGTLHIAALFHRIEILEWLHEEMFPELTLTMLDNDGMNVLHAATQSCFLEGMKMCLQNNRYRYNLIHNKKKKHEKQTNKKPKINLNPRNTFYSQNTNTNNNNNINDDEDNNNMDLNANLSLENMIDDCDDEPFDLIRFNQQINQNVSMLDDFVDINSRSFSGWSPIRMAVRYGHLDAARYLLAHKSLNANVVTHAGVAPIHFACKYGDLEICYLLLDKIKIDVNFPTESQMTPLHFAVINGHIPIVRYLLSFPSIDVNAKDSDNNTPLNLAIRYGMTLVAKLLINDPRVDVNSKSEGSRSSLYLCVKYNRYSIFSALIQRDDLEINSIEDESLPVNCLHRAAQDNYYKFINDLIDIGKIDTNIPDKNGLTPLHYACKSNSIESVKALIECKDTNVNAQSMNDKTAPLHFAASGGFKEIIYLLCSRDDLDVNIRTSHQMSALHLACINNKCESVAALSIRDDVDFNAVNDKGATALHIAVSKGFYNVVDVLLSSPNINVDATLSNGARAIDIARGKHFNDIALLIKS